MRVENVSIKILYEDNHLLVVEKPPNILSQGDLTGDPDMLALLKADIKKRYQKPGEVYLGLVHRLDRPVGGVMVFARTSKAASRLSDQIRKGDFQKTYLAVVHGVPGAPEATLENYLSKDTALNKVSVARAFDPAAKKAVLHYRVVDSKEGLTLVRIHLETGRPHQIRVQFSHAGHPLYGDHRYGQEQQAGVQIALWSASIELTHPTRKARMKFESEPPKVYPWELFSTCMVMPNLFT